MVSNLYCLFWAIYLRKETGKKELVIFHHKNDEFIFYPPEYIWNGSNIFTEAFGTDLD